MIMDIESHLPPRVTLLEKIGPSVHPVFGVDANGELTGRGTGFLVGEERYLVTNYHVLEDKDRSFLGIVSDDIYLIDQVIAFDKEKDIFICSPRDLPKDLPYLSLSSQIPATGSPIAVIGYLPTGSIGLEPIHSPGIVSSIRKNLRGYYVHGRLQTFGKTIQMTAPCPPGSSGSPVVTMSGAVIGVVTSTLASDKNVSFAVPGSVVQDMIASADQPLGFSSIAAANRSVGGYDPVASWRSKWPGY